MFDIGWSEILVIAAVAIVVVGPKDLPRMLRTFGKTMGQVRRTANDFKRQFDEALREAEREAGLDDAKKQISAVAKPLTDVKKDFDATMRAADKPVPAESPEPDKTGDHPHTAEPAKTGAPAPALEGDAAKDASTATRDLDKPIPASVPEPDKTGDHPHTAEPLKTGAPTPAHGTDAA